MQPLDDVVFLTDRAKVSARHSSGTLRTQMLVAMALGAMHATSSPAWGGMSDFYSDSTGAPAQVEFGELDPERVFERTGEMKREAMQRKTQNRARAVLGPKKSRYM